MKINYPIRLNSYLSKAGIGSRRFCENLIEEGRVKINNKKVIQMGEKVEKNDVVYFDNILVEPITNSYYYLLNKPRGWVCTNSDKFAKKIARDLILTENAHLLFNVGRLDKESEGLLLFTNDGDFSYNLTHPKKEVEKEYMVHLKTPIDKRVLIQATKGLKIKNQIYKIKSFSIESKYWINIILTEGKNREIRMILENSGMQIHRLVRVRIGNLTLGNLKLGSFRALNKAEIKSLKEL